MFNISITTIIKVIASIFPFLSEVLFDSITERSFTDPLFDIKRVVITVVFIISILLNGWLFYRLVVVSKAYMEVNRAYVEVINKIENIKALGPFSIAGDNTQIIRDDFDNYKDKQQYDKAIKALEKDRREHIKQANETIKQE